jgi:predicted nucleic acid-binding Zn ribbon protein
MKYITAIMITAGITTNHIEIDESCESETCALTKKGNKNSRRKKHFIIAVLVFASRSRFI